MAELKAVVFDMDDTLLSINLSAFIGMFALDEANLLAQAARKSPVSLFAPVGSAMLELNSGIREDGDTRTNQEFFADQLKSRCGIPLFEPAILDMLEFYEREVLPKKNDRIVAARPREGAHQAIETVLGRGMRIALLTNPSFSRACIECRMGWGRLADVPFELVTTWENSSRVKPSADYYRDSLSKLGLSPEETLMVGNDPKRDFPAPDIGLKTAYVGNGTQPHALWNGSMLDFARHFDEIEEAFNRR